MKQRESFGDPQPRGRKPLLKRKKHIGKEKKGGQKKSEVKTKKIDVGNAQGEHDSDRGKKQSRHGNHQKHPERRWQRSQAEERQHHKKASTIDRSAGDRPQHLTSEDIVRLDGRREHGIVSFFKNKPDINVIGNLEARAVHGRDTNQSWCKESDVACSADLGNVSTDADTDGK